jgi:hypothetical protein
MMCNGSLQRSLKGNGNGSGISWIKDLGDTQNYWTSNARKHPMPHSAHNGPIV